MKRTLSILCLLASLGIANTSYAKETPHTKTPSKSKTEKATKPLKEDGFLTVQVFAVDMPDMKLVKKMPEYIIRANATGSPLVSDFSPDYKESVIKRGVRSTQNIISDMTYANKMQLVGLQTIPFSYKKDDQIILIKTYQYDYTYPKGISFSQSKPTTTVAKGTLTLGYILASRLEDIKGTPYIGTRTILTFTHPKSGKLPIKQLDPKHKPNYGNPNVDTQVITRNFKMSSGQTVWFNQLQNGTTYDGHHTMLVVGITAVIFNKPPYLK